MLAEVRTEYLEFSRRLRSGPLDEKLVKQAAAAGVRCRILLEAPRSTKSIASA